MPQKSKNQFDQYIDELVRGFEQGTHLAHYLLDNETWDVFMVHFQQTDWIQHRLWGHIERACADALDKTPEVEAVRNCYKRFDSLLGTLIEKLSPNVSAITVLSDHGFGPRRGDIYPNYFLAQWGYLHANRNETSAIEKVKAYFHNSKVPGLQRIYHVLRRVKYSIQKEANPLEGHKGWADALGTSLSKRTELIDWTKTMVVTIYAYQFAYLYVNVCGRSPNGLVQPGEDYESLISDLTRRFRDIRHPETSEKLLEAVVRGSDMYPHAPNGVLIPDLVLIPTDGYGFSFLISDEPPKSINEGNHRHNGVFLIQGAGLKHPVDGFCPKLVDVAPTLLHLLGLPVPSDMDGRVLEEIFENPVGIQIEQVDNQLSSEERREYSREEEYLIEERLKGLGYVE
jgi:predicted AlkP superfamily phosphohydrolase/phosphomutase